MIDVLRWLSKHLLVWFVPRETRPFEAEMLREKEELEREKEQRQQFDKRKQIELEQRQRQEFPEGFFGDTPVAPFLKEPEGADERQFRSNSRKNETE